MVIGGAVYPTGQAWRPSSDDGHARGCECLALYRGKWLRLAASAQVLSAGIDGAALFLRLAQHRFARGHEHGARDEPTRDRRARSLAERRCDRQPVRENHRKRGPCGYDAGKKIKGRKRHILADTCGFLIFILVHTADIQDRDGAVDVLKAVRKRFPWLRHVFADGGYAGDKLRNALAGSGAWTIKIIKRSDKAKGFHVLPRRWVVERTFAWLGRCRRLAKDWETTVASSTAWATIASIRMLTRRTARYCFA